MGIPSYGAAPLSATFVAVRAMQFISMIIILGITGHFVDSMVQADFSPSHEIVGTLSITSMVTLYTLVSVAFYWSVANVGLFVMAGIDSLILIAWIVISVVVGRPVSYLNCYYPGRSGNGHILVDLLQNINEEGSTLSLANWTGLNKANCFETKTIWGLSIALAILFATSAILLPTLHYKNKKVGGYTKTVV